MRYCLGLLLLATPLEAQRLDPDWDWFAKDSREHFAAGMLVGAGARVVLHDAKPWQRIVTLGVIALAWELGQESAAAECTRGYCIGVKDWILTTAGGVLVELIWGALN